MEPFPIHVLKALAQSYPSFLLLTPSLIKFFYSSQYRPASSASLRACWTLGGGSRQAKACCELVRANTGANAYHNENQESTFKNTRRNNSPKFFRHAQASVSHLEDSMIEMPLAED